MDVVRSTIKLILRLTNQMISALEPSTRATLKRLLDFTTIILFQLFFVVVILVVSFGFERLLATLWASEPKIFQGSSLEFGISILFKTINVLAVLTSTLAVAVAGIKVFIVSSDQDD